MNKIGTIDMNTGQYTELMSTFDYFFPINTIAFYFGAPGSSNNEGDGTGSGATDTDGDGIEDYYDEYPNDINRAYNSYIPSQTGWNTYAFEDLWPSRGDYDFNDLVVKVRDHFILNAQNKYVEKNSTYQIQHIGGSFHNGFGRMYNISPSSVNYYSLGSVEANQSNAVEIVFSNVYDIGTENEIITQTLYADGGIDNLTNISTFLIANENRGAEIGLPDALPTDLVDVSKFGTKNDDSNPSISRYYKTPENLSWGILIPEGNYALPSEKVEILNGYIHFQDWAESGGTLFTDWYLDIPGYRNNAYLQQ